MPAPRPASGWKSSEFFGTFGATGGVLFIAYEMVGQGQLWPAVAVVIAGAVLPGLYTSKRLSLKARAMSESTPTNIDPIDIFAEAIITKTAGAFAPAVAKVLVGQGIDPELAAVKATNLVTGIAGLIVDGIDIVTDIKTARQLKTVAAAGVAAGTAAAKVK